MPRNTDDFIEEFVSAGSTAGEAELLVRVALQEGFHHTLSFGEERDDKIKDFAETAPLREISRLFEPSEPPRGIDIGAALPIGLTFETTDSPDLFIPSSGRCFLKAVEKAFGVDWSIDPNFHRIIKDHKLSEYEQKTPTLAKVIKALGYSWITDVPRVLKIVDGRWVQMNSRQTSPNGYIALIPVGKAFHSVWIKHGKPNRGQLTPEEVKLRVKAAVVPSKQDFEELIFEQSRVCSFKATLPNHQDLPVFCYDIETTSCKAEDGSESLHPWAVGVGVAHLPTPYIPCVEETSEGKTTAEFSPPPRVFNDGDSEYHLFEGLDCIEQFVSYLGSLQLTKAFLFAHNGSRFDHLFLHTSPNVHIVTAILSNGIKSEKLKIGESIFILRDSMMFTQLSLAESAKALQVPTQKTTCDIAGKSPEWYQSNPEIWKPYLYADVHALIGIVTRMHAALQVFGESIIGSPVGIAGVAWALLQKSCPAMMNTHLVKSENVRKFIRTALYGGRVLHWKKRGKNLISLDCNSLYPAAMAEGCYPIGRYSVIPIEGLVSIRTNGKLYQDNHPYIAEVTLNAGNIRYPTVPARSSSNGLIYPAGVFRGVYCSVDLQEAVALGYTIVEVHAGIYWKDSANIFKHLIHKLYNRRKELQKTGNPLQYTIKILLNAMYGKFAEQYDTAVGYSKAPEETARKKISSTITLPNGQKQTKFKLTTPIVRKPQYIACFILAYARKIMNRIIANVGPENIYYSDTDSVYIPVECADNPKVIENLSNTLGAFKNDYGANVNIKEAIFADYKRYLCILSTGHIAAKFNGLNFKTTDHLTNNASKDALEKERKEQDPVKKAKLFLIRKEKIMQIKKFFEDVVNTNKTNIPIKVYQEKWLRQVGTADGEVVISKKDMKYIVCPNTRAKWHEDEFFPLGYIKTIEERPFQYESTSHTHAPSRFIPNYQMWETHFRTSVPPTSTSSGMAVISDRNFPVTTNWGVTSNGVKPHTGGIYHTSTVKGKKGIRIATEYGPGAETEVDPATIYPVLFFAVSSAEQHSISDLDQNEVSDLFDNLHRVVDRAIQKQKDAKREEELDGIEEEFYDY